MFLDISSTRSILQNTHSLGEMDPTTVTGEGVSVMGIAVGSKDVNSNNITAQTTVARKCSCERYTHSMRLNERLGQINMRKNKNVAIVLVL